MSAPVVSTEILQESGEKPAPERTYTIPEGHVALCS